MKTHLDQWLPERYARSVQALRVALAKAVQQSMRPPPRPPRADTVPPPNAR